MKISEVMNKAVVMEDEMSLKEAAKIMSDKNIGSLIALDKKEEIVGIVTERDILKNVGKLGEKVSSIMTEKVVTIESNDSMDNAALVMAKYKIKRLPVTKRGKLVGIITATDILANSSSIGEEFLLD
jgi:CBS domain-containing protein